MDIRNRLQTYRAFAEPYLSWECVDASVDFFDRELRRHFVNEPHLVFLVAIRRGVSGGIVVITLPYFVYILYESIGSEAAWGSYHISRLWELSATDHGKAVVIEFRPPGEEKVAVLSPIGEHGKLQAQLLNEFANELVGSVIKQDKDDR